MRQDLSFTTDRKTVSRVLGGTAALTYPLLLVGVALGTGFRKGGDYSDLAASFLAALLFLVAAPTAWIFSFDFVDPDRFTIVFVGSLTSFPLWFMAGSAVARRTHAWARWLFRYSLICVGWTVANIVFFVVLAWLFG